MTAHAQHPPQSLSQKKFAQSEVEGFLRRAPSFQAMPPAKQQQVLADTHKVVGFIAEAGGDEVMHHMLGAKSMAGYNAQRPVPARQMARPLNEGGRPDDQKTDSEYVDDAGQALANVVDAVDFPGFVAELIQGVFQAIVDASIQQMEAFAELVANVAKSVDAFMKDNVSEDQARDFLVNQYPDHLQPDLASGKVALKPEADTDNAPDFLSDLGLPFDLGDVEDEEQEQQLVAAGRKKIAMDRQQMLATMVLMGLNRIIVTDGQIRASVVFDLNTKAMETENEERSRSFEYGRETDYTRKSKRSKKGFLWIKPKTSGSSKLNVKTDTTYKSDSSNEEERTRETELKAKLTGNVDLRFKSDVFPLEKMTELMGTNTEMITQNARQPPAAADPNAPPPPSVPIPPAPTS
ncbi:hypothetical protein [Yoonia sp.]|uniref:hypothetical protein n=1 Tax=Yoonia sp. TaxID=2212373 RepID=UPI00358F7867